MRLSENEEQLLSRSVDQSEFIKLLASVLYGSRTDAMLEGFGNAFNLFPNDDDLLELHLKRLIVDRYGTYLDWATIGEALWDAIDEFRDTLDEEQLAELDSRLRRL